MSKKALTMKAVKANLVPEMKTVQCDKCGGSGVTPDHCDVGAKLRAMRKAKRLSIREISRRMGFSAPYLLDLETGSRNWSDDKIEAYKKALNHAA